MAFNKNIYFKDQSLQSLALPPADTQQLLVEKIVKLQKACARRQVNGNWKKWLLYKCIPRKNWIFWMNTLLNL